MTKQQSHAIASRRPLELGYRGWSVTHRPPARRVWGQRQRGRRPRPQSLTEGPRYAGEPTETRPTGDPPTTPAPKTARTQPRPAAKTDPPPRGIADRSDRPKAAAYDPETAAYLARDFESLFGTPHQYWERFRRYFQSRRLPSDDAEDQSTEAAIELIRVRKHFNPNLSKFYTWAMVVAYRKYCKWLRNKPTRNLEPLPPDVPDRGHDAERHRAEVSQYFVEMEPLIREILSKMEYEVYKRWIAGMTNQEIADELGISVRLLPSRTADGERLLHWRGPHPEREKVINAMDPKRTPAQRVSEIKNRILRKLRRALPIFQP